MRLQNNVATQLKIMRGLTDDMLCTADLQPPMNIKDMDKGVDILKEAKEKDWKVTVVGDYDTDGLISIYAGLYGLRDFGIKRLGYIVPDRFKDGYGISDAIIDRILKSDCTVVLTCDNGTSATEKLSELRNRGIKVIVTDHHKVPDVRADVDAFINPHQLGDTSRFKDYCGAGVMLQLLRALGISKQALLQLYPFIAIATVCDSMPLLYDNRLLVKLGMKAAKYTRNLGLNALAVMAGLDTIANLSVYDMGYRIGPRLNAKGRLDNATDVVKLFLTKNNDLICQLLQDIEDTNRQRQALTEKGQKEVEALLGESKDDRVIAVCKSGLHPGVIGIVASRIKDKYGLPTIIMTNKDDMHIVGSARSTDTVNMYSLVKGCREYLDSFGGHPKAAGLNLQPSNLTKFLCATQRTAVEKEKLRYDFELDCDTITLGEICELSELEPFGEGNPKPKFKDKQLIIRTVIYDKVIKLYTSNGTELVLFSRLFNIINQLESKGVKQTPDNSYEEFYLDYLYTPKVNRYLGKESVQIVVEEILNIERG